MPDLSGKKIAVLVDNYFEEAEFVDPIKELRDAGAEVEVIAPKMDTLQALNHADHGNTYKPDRTLDEVRVDEYDALLLPGGAVNADSLRMNIQARIWIRKFMESNKPIAAICHAPWALISAGVAAGRQLTSYFTIQDDLRNAGATWMDEEVVVDNNLITSRKPEDIPAFDKALIQMLQAA